jgi:hypothetical protein
MVREALASGTSYCEIVCEIVCAMVVDQCTRRRRTGQCCRKRLLSGQDKVDRELRPCEKEIARKHD